MAKQIKGDKVIEDNHLDNAIKSGEDLLVIYKKLDEQIIKTAKDLKKISSAKGGQSAKGIQDLNKALSESTKQKQAAITVDKQKETLEIKLKALNSDRIQQNEELKVQISQQAKANKQLAREKLNLVGAYERESKLLIKLRKELKDLVLTEGEASSKTKKLANDVSKLDAKLKKADATAGQFQRNVGNYPKGLKGAIGSLKQFAGALGLVGGVQLLTKGIKNMFNVVKDFDQATADLSSVLGVNKEDMGALTAQAKELGATTKFTASAVAQLQIEYAKLGFTQKEIEGVTEATLQLAAASGTDLGNAATIVGSTLRAFNLDVDQTQRLVDVMAKSFSSSSLDIEKFSSAMANVAPAAAAVGLTIEETTALIGTLTDAGIDAGSAGTGLRNMFLDAKKQGIDFEDALEQIANSTDQLGTSFDIFGKKGSTLGVILANNADGIADLTAKLGDAGGAAKEMADKQLDTLGGSIDLLQSAWEGWILKMNESGGAGEKLKKVIKFLADNLDTILSTIISVAKAFVTYKVVTFLATKATRLYRLAIIATTKGMKTFNKVAKLNPWGLIATALITIVPLIWDFVDSLIGATEEVEELSAAQQILDDVSRETNVKLVEEQATLKAVFLALKATTAGTEARQKALDQVNAKYGTTLKNLDDEAAFVRQVDAAYKNLLSTLKEKIRLEIVQEKLTNLLKDQLATEASLINSQAALAKKRADIGLGSRTITTEDPLTGFLTFTEVFDESFEDDVLEQFVNIAEGRIAIIQEQIDALLSSNKDSIDAIFGAPDVAVGGTGKGKGGKKTLIDFSEEEELLQFNARKQRRDDLLKQQIENNKILEDNEKAHLAEINRINKQQEDDDKKRLDQERKERKQRLKDLKKFRDESLKIAKQISDDLAKELDKKIAARQKGIEEKETEIARLQGLAAQGNTDAAEAIKAEKIAVAKEKLEVERLEKRKKNLLITVAGLERASQLIGSGNSTPFATAGGEIQNFLSNLKSLSEGTDYNIGQTLGRAQRSGTDGHLMWADGREKLLSIKNSDKLGGMHQDEVTRRALAYNNDFVNHDSISGTVVKQMTDRNIVRKLDSVVEAVKKIRIVQQHIDLSTGQETIVDGNKTTNIDHKPTTFKV